MARWKILNADKAEELGIKEVETDSSGFIVIDKAKIPIGMSVKNVVEFAEKFGIILEESIKH